MLFTAIFAVYALFIVAVLARVWFLWAAPRRERVQVDALESAWALSADEVVRR